MTKYIPRSFDDGNVSGVVEHFEHDGAVELSRGVLAELQLYQALGVQRLARARVHLVLLDEWQDVQEVKNMALSEKIKSTVKSIAVRCIQLYGMDLNYHFNNYLVSTSSSQYGLAKGCRLREQWSNGSLLKSISSGSVALPGFLPPKKYFHS